jgi:molybdopterin-guanine dinucleotide biosynthesis protein A
VSAFDAVPADVDVVVAACDLVDLDEATVRCLWPDDVDDGDVDVVVARTDRLEPLLARWRPSARERTRAAFAAGSRAAIDAIHGLRRIEVDVAVERLRNVNTPGDLGR